VIDRSLPVVTPLKISYSFQTNRNHVPNSCKFYSVNESSSTCVKGKALNRKNQPCVSMETCALEGRLRRHEGPKVPCAADARLGGQGKHPDDHVMEENQEGS
jgi:hypothetical protein